ncbi:MAG TPA: GerMN domain-containing protein [Acidobacteriaceae bacterium]|nr:GerMN domain-containing protein [Acidobacteriaceae bacterium]
MISRAHKVLFGVLLLACVAMAAVLIRLRNRAQDRLQEQAAGAPAMEIPGGVPPTEVTLYVPNDLDDSLVAVHENLALPQGESAEAQELLTNLVAAFHAPGSTHPIDVANGVNEVYLMPVPKAAGATGNSGQLAVVDLTAALAAEQPSGIEPETLTLLAMMATLHANLPAITEVHFLVDGQPRETLAGHADLTRTYLASEANPTPNPEAAEGAQ